MKLNTTPALLRRKQLNFSGFAIAVFLFTTFVSQQLQSQTNDYLRARKALFVGFDYNPKFTAIRPSNESHFGGDVLFKKNLLFGPKGDYRLDKSGKIFSNGLNVRNAIDLNPNGSSYFNGLARFNKGAHFNDIVTFGSDDFFITPLGKASLSDLKVTQGGGITVKDAAGLNDMIILNPDGTATFKGLVTFEGGYTDQSPKQDDGTGVQSRPTTANYSSDVYNYDNLRVRDVMIIGDPNNSESRFSVLNRSGLHVRDHIRLYDILNVDAFGIAFDGRRGVSRDQAYALDIRGNARFNRLNIKDNDNSGGAGSFVIADILNNQGVLELRHDQNFLSSTVSIRAREASYINTDGLAIGDKTIPNAPFGENKAKLFVNGNIQLSNTGKFIGDGSKLTGIDYNNLTNKPTIPAETWKADGSNTYYKGGKAKIQDSSGRDRLILGPNGTVTLRDNVNKDRIVLNSNGEIKSSDTGTFIRFRFHPSEDSYFNAPSKGVAIGQTTIPNAPSGENKAKLFVNGNIQLSNTGKFIGDGSKLTGITYSQISGTPPSDGGSTVR